MHIMAIVGQQILSIIEDGREKRFLVLTIDQLFEVRRLEPHRLRKIDDQWCVEVHSIN